MELLNWILAHLGVTPVTLADVSEFLRRYGYGILFLGTLFEGEAVVIIAGALAHTGILSWPGVILAAWAGSTLNDQILYLLGYRYGTRLVGWLPRFLRRHVERAEALIRRFGDWITVLFRFIYGTRTITPILLGVHRYHPRRYFWVNLVAALLWSVLISAAGYLLAASLPVILRELRYVQILFLVLLLMGAAYFLWRQWRRRRQ
ncbi:DedA family protein [Candidatus Igneacidithiobacillus taiwanensis]|uniref:DedA family protein n=1 Tax=Candidatus Igneacidithiobacillus taiwanensis TaxID=1945924 RepID=UPI00289BB7D7|nr:DedA family protein [Candidatus Igneacidithiobacillus taiwanensis]